MFWPFLSFIWEVGRLIVATDEETAIKHGILYILKDLFRRKRLQNHWEFHIPNGFPKMLHDHNVCAHTDRFVPKSLATQQTHSEVVTTLLRRCVFAGNEQMTTEAVWNRKEIIYFCILFIVTMKSSNLTVGIKHVFYALTFAKSRGKCWKPRPKSAVFNDSLGTWRTLMHSKTMFSRYYCIKTENICYISRYFLHYFVSPFNRCLANAISTDYAHSRAGQYSSLNGSKSVAPVRSYWKLRSRALTARELPC